MANGGLKPLTISTIDDLSTNAATLEDALCQIVYVGVKIWMSLTDRSSYQCHRQSHERAYAMIIMRKLQ